MPELVERQGVFVFLGKRQRGSAMDYEVGLETILIDRYLCTSTSKAGATTKPVSFPNHSTSRAGVSTASAAFLLRPRLS